MYSKKFDKLVRDKIPQIVKDEGNEVKYEIETSLAGLQIYCENKIMEETEEVLKARTRDEVLAELADLFEIGMKYGKDCWSIQPYEILQAMADKERRCGKFTKNIILKEIIYK